MVHCHAALGLDRYKFVVQVVIGEQRGEGVKWVWIKIIVLGPTLAHVSANTTNSINFTQDGQ